MAYIELYNKEILDLVTIGKSSNEFDPKRGDYIKVQIFESKSNKLLSSSCRKL